MGEEVFDKNLHGLDKFLYNKITAHYNTDTFF